MSTPPKRERADGDSAMAVSLPHKLQRVLAEELSPVSPTVAAGILPRSSVYAPPPAPVPAPAPTSSRAATADPILALEVIRSRLARTTDAHLQARLLLRFSHVAISPGAPTNSAIDFLFSFLQQSQATQASADGKSERDGGDQSVQRTTGGPIVVGAIVRGLRTLLAVKAKVVEPMIQVDAMGEQLMQCVSVAEDFKLRQDMLQIVLDCLVITRAYGQVETLLGTCVRDHDPAMQAICLQGYMRLHDAGYHFGAEPVKLFDLASTLLLHSGEKESESVQLWAVRLIAALSGLHPHLDASSKFFSSSSAPSTLRDRAFYVLCIGASAASPSVRKEIALSLRAFTDASTRVVEHALQKTQISEELADETEMRTVLMLSSGMLLDLLEDKSCNDVATEASRTIGYLAKAATWSEQILDRTISAHVDLLLPAATPAVASNAKASFLVLVRTLELLLKQRKTQYRAAFSLTSEEVSYILRDEGAKQDASVMLSILSVLLQCDTCSVWMVQRIVEYALLIADTVVDHGIEPGAVSSVKRQLLALAKSIRLQCGATIQMDTSLADKLERHSHEDTNRVKTELCLVLLSNKQAVQAIAPRERGSGSRSLKQLFKFAQPEISPRPSTKLKEASEYGKLLESSYGGDESFTSQLKTILRLRSGADVKSEVSGLRIVEMLLQLKQFVKPFPDPAPAPKAASSYVSMDAMLGNTSSASSESDREKAEAFARLSVPVALLRGCEEIVELASDLYVKESGLSCGSRADLVQLVLLARVGLVITRLQPLSSDDHEIPTSLQWLAEQATQLRFLRIENAGAKWFGERQLGGVASLNELKRAFVDLVRKAWPRAFVLALEGLRSQPSRTTAAVIHEPRINCKEPREIIAQWPFTVRVRGVVESLSDITRVFIKTVLPNGETEYHRVPVHTISFKANPASYLVDHSIKLTVSPFSDPTSYSVALCLQHPALPGALKMEASNVKGRAHTAFTAISEPVQAQIFHRTNSTIRRG